MNTEKMTVHRALAELKVIGSRIEKKIVEARFCEASKHSNKKINGVPIADFKDNVRDGYKSIVALINRRNAIKRAVVLSNAKTEVEINGKKYTVAEAIEMKNSGIEYKKSLLNSMRYAYSNANSVLDKQNGDVLEERARKYVEGLYGGKDAAVKSEEAENAYKMYIENNTYDLIDPIGVDGEIEKLEDQIDKFMADVDSVLSVSNSLTEIEFSYETE